VDYLEYFGLTSEPFSHAPISRYYYSSRQHTDALRRLLHVAQTMKGLAILIGDIGHGKTTLARRMLDAMPENEFEAALLVIVHAGVTANWLLRRIATQLGVTDVAEDKLTILSQLYARLFEIHKSGKKAVVLIDEAQMLGTRELMEEFRGLLNLEVPDHKLISFVFFGLPEIETNLRLDPPLAQRVALRYHLKPLTPEDTAAYVAHRLRLAGAKGTLFLPEALARVHDHTHGVPRVINTLCDNVLLEMFFAKVYEANAELVDKVAHSLALHERDLPPPVVQPPPADEPAMPGSRGEDAIVPVTRGDESPSLAGGESIEAIAARIASEAPVPDDPPPRTRAPLSVPPPSIPAPAPMVAAPRGLDIDDPLSFLAPDGRDEAAPEGPEVEIPVADASYGLGSSLSGSDARSAPVPLPESETSGFEVDFGDFAADPPLRPLWSPRLGRRHPTDRPRRSRQRPPRW
jgi:general secretion pathway protein A